MSHLRIFSVFLFCATLLSSCATSDRWIVDDVYDVKSAMIPVDTDVNDETDYNAFVYKKTIEEKQEVYVDQYNIDRSFNRSFVFFDMNQYRRNFNLCGCGSQNINYSPSSFHNQYFANMYGCNDYYGLNYGYANNGYFYNPYYGNGYFGNSYGNPYSNNSYYNPYWNTNNNPNTYTANNVLNGPRGSISGFGGVSSRQANVLKSTPTIGRVGKESVNSSNSTKINENVGSRNERVSSIRTPSSNVKRPSSSIQRTTGTNPNTPQTSRPRSNEATPSRNGSGGNVNSLPRNNSPSENRGGRSSESGSGGNSSRGSGGSGKPSVSPQKVGRP